MASDTAVKQLWDDYYAASDGDTILKDANFFRMEVTAISEALNREVVRLGRPVSILEFGSGTGALAETLLAALPGEFRDGTSYCGVDFSVDACAKANARNLADATFVAEDFLRFLDRNEQRFDLIVTQRSIMAVIAEDQHTLMLESLPGALAPAGALILSEATQQAFDRVNALRSEVDISSMEPIWHCRYLDEGQVSRLFPTADFQDFASLYWLITRVIYPFSAEPLHNTPLHDMAARLEQTGDFGLVKLIVVSKPQ